MYNSPGLRSRAVRLPPTPCRVCFRPRVFNKFSHFWQKSKVVSKVGATARQGHQVAQRARGGTTGRRRSRVGASRHPGTGAPCRARVRLSSRCPADWTLRWATTWTRILDHCADMNGAPLTRTPPRQSWGRGPSPLGVAANPGPSVDVSFTASCAAPTGRVPGLRGASSSPVHRALVLVLGTNIAVLLDCSKSSRQCSLPYLLTYLKIEKEL